MKRITRNIPTPGPDQQCSKCDLVKPRSDFYVKYPASGKLFPWCKKCHKKKQTKIKLRIVRDEPRICRKCRKFKLDNEFRADRWQCFSCEKQRDIESTKRKEIRFRTKHRAKLAANAIAKYRADPVNSNAQRRRVRALEPERYNSYANKWKHTHRENGRASEHRRKARIVGNGGTWTPAEWEAIKVLYNYTCLWCRKQEPEIRLSPDHIVPLSHGGLNIATNLQPLCMGTGKNKIGGCNYRKHAKTFDLRPYWPGDNPDYVELPDGSLFYLRPYRLLP